MVESPGELLGRSAGDDPAGADDQQPIGEVLRLVHVVSGEDDRLAELLEAVDHAPRLPPSRRVEPGGRLVEEDKVRIADQSERDVDAALLPPGSARDAFAAFLGEPDEVDRLVNRPRASSRTSRTATPSPAPSGLEVELRPPAGTMPMRSRQARAGLAGSVPSTETSPAVRGRYPSRISIVVVLPAPFVPRRPKHSPSSTSKSIPHTASWVPYDFRSPLTTIAGAIAGNDHRG